MDNATLRSLAAEREARRGRPAAPPPAAAAAAAAAAPRRVGGFGAPAARGAAPPSDLAGAHRSIRLARALGLLLLAVAGLLLCVGAGARRSCVVAVAAVAVARWGAASLHGALPAMLVEGAPPTPAEAAAAAARGFWAGDAAALGAEYANALESLAFACTYGKTNCLTSEMYAGDLSLGKIASLVGGKLRDGVVKCD